MNTILHKRAKDLPCKHERHGEYEYYKYAVVSQDGSDRCVANRYEIPPGKSAYPYHYHTQREELYYFLSGTGRIKTPEGEKEITAGDFFFFPAGEAGAHKLTNTSETELLVYLDFDAKDKIDITVYPDSGKIGIWGDNINKVFREKDNIGYYDGE